MLGFHVHKTKDLFDKKRTRNILDALKEDLPLANKWLQSVKTPAKFDCAQIFVCGPQNHNMSIDEFEANKISEQDIKILTHGAYIDNPWNLSGGSMINIGRELKMIENFGRNNLGLVIHMSNNTDKTYKQVLNQIGENIGDITGTLFLETHTAKNNKFADASALNKLFGDISECDMRGVKIGLCLDTAHLFASGLDITDDIIAKKFLTELNIPQNIYALHFNDSQSSLNSGVDIHGCIGTKIWRNDTNNTKIKRWTDWAHNKSAPIILERNDATIKTDIELLQKIYN